MRRKKVDSMLLNSSILKSSMLLLACSNPARILNASNQPYKLSKRE